MVVSYEILGLRIIKIKRWERLIIYRYFNVNIICYKWGYLDIKLLGKKIYNIWMRLFGVCRRFEKRFIFLLE